jgi:hypothetical protein
MDLLDVLQKQLCRRTEPIARLSGIDCSAFRMEMAQSDGVKHRTFNSLSLRRPAKGRVSETFGVAAKLRIPPSTLETRIKALTIDKRRLNYG